MPGLVAELHKEYDGKVIPCMGTDGVVWIDGRLGPERRREQILEAIKINRHRDKIVSYQIGWLGHGGSWAVRGPVVPL